ncbi:MAG: monovalent cation/H(+) antiporter subunit G [Methanophagales archaeon]|nr:monovalent cation/H(+) antiporter subunit G [Methanophagales archaeon]
MIIYNIIFDLLLILLLSIGTLFFIVGTIGLIRFPDVYTRLHAATKCDTLGLGMIFAGIMLYEGATFASVKIMFIVIFIFLTNPTAAHAIARAAHIHGIKLWEKTVVDMYKEDEKREGVE